MWLMASYYVLLGVVGGAMSVGFRLVFGLCLVDWFSGGFVGVYGWFCFWLVLVSC